MEIQAYTPLDTKKLEQLQRATCRQFQCLPERTAAVAIYTLIGAEPIETTLDKNAMILFTTLARLDSSIEKDILIWEMENSKEEDRFFICRIRKTLQKYNLPASTLRIHNVAVWLLFGQVPFLRENYVATTYFRYVICKSL
jgi:hypothetical protein